MDGKVAIYYNQPAPRYVKLDEREYVFDCRHGVSLALVSEEDVQRMLDYLGGCCGGKRQIFFLASQALYSHWLDGNGGR